jgi:fluoroquinolone resistance protein
MTELNELKDPGATEFYERIFEKLDYENEDLRGKEFHHCKFVQCNLKGVDFSKAVFNDCKFEKCDLSLIKIEKTVFQDLLVGQSKMVGIDWTISGLQKKPKLHNRLTFIGSDISFSLFIDCNLRGISIMECKAKEVDFSGADLCDSKLIKTDFERATFFGTNLGNADFTNAVNYLINVCDNKVTKAKFSFPEVLDLVKIHGIVIEGLD